MTYCTTTILTFRKLFQFLTFFITTLQHSRTGLRNFGGLEDNNEGEVGINTDSTYRLKNHFLKNDKIFNEILTFLIKNSKKL
jgi:hypothetical protein